MCNRYEQKGTASQIRKLAARLKRKMATTSATDNLPAQDNIYPDQDAPIVINTADNNLELTMARWGFPPIPGEKAPITNIRNLKSKWWRDVNREWMTAKEYRCLVPFTAFAEPVRDSTWFTVPDVEVAYFAGVWRPWQGERLAEQPRQTRRVREQREWRLFSFLTTDANDVVQPIHPKAMPVILIDPAKQIEWLSGGEESLQLQRPLSNHQLVMREEA
jgi:putative SOS response-associated peptidase YedK